MEETASPLKRRDHDGSLHIVYDMADLPTHAADNPIDHKSRCGDPPVNLDSPTRAVFPRVAIPFATLVTNLLLVRGILAHRSLTFNTHCATRRRTRFHHLPA